MPIVGPCRNRWCPRPAAEDGWCEAHRRPRHARYAGLPPGWEGTRARQLRLFPFCAECGALATEVHHAGPRRERLVSLCHRCHARITGREGGQAWP